MPDLFVNLMKEEWRIHSTMFGSISFALFPVMVFFIVFMGSFLAPLLSSTIPGGDLAFLAHATFLLLGFMVGGFGILGNEVMNRRFGQASLLVYSARSLPLSGRFIFANFVVKDIVYYFFLWVLPFVAGYIAASPFTITPLSRGLLLLPSLSLAFLLGLCVVFLLSSLYVRSKPALLCAVAIGAGAATASALLSGRGILLLFPPYLLYREFSWPLLLGTVTATGAMFVLSILLFSPGSENAAGSGRNVFPDLARYLSFLPHPPLVAKDLIDLSRSGIGIGQTLFSFLLPLGAIWYVLSLLRDLLPSHGVIVIFSLTTGVIASTMYTWVTEFDSFWQYACLPLAQSTLIAGKMTTFSLLQAIPACFSGAVAVLAGRPDLAVPSILLCLSISVFAACGLAFLCGLSPSVLLYDVRVLLSYLVLNGAALSFCAALALADPLYSLFSPLLLVPALLLVRGAKTRWDAREPGAI